MGRRNLNLEGSYGSGQEEPQYRRKVWQWAGETSVLKEGLAEGRRNLSLKGRSGRGQKKSQFRRKVWQWAGETLIATEGPAVAGETSVEKEGLSVGRINLSLGRRLDSGQEKSQFRKKVWQWAGETLILDVRSNSACSGQDKPQSSRKGLSVSKKTP